MLKQALFNSCDRCKVFLPLQRFFIRDDGPRSGGDSWGRHKRWCR